MPNDTTGNFMRMKKFKKETDLNQHQKKVQGVKYVKKEKEKKYSDFKLSFARGI